MDSGITLARDWHVKPHAHPVITAILPEVQDIPIIKMNSLGQGARDILSKPLKI